MTKGRYFCEKCLNRQSTPGDCPTCAGEPLLDLSDPEIRQMLQSFDDQRKTRHYSFMLGLILVVSSPLSIGLVFLSWLFVPISAGLVVGLTALAIKIRPAKVRMPKVTDDEISGWLSGEAYEKS